MNSPTPAPLHSDEWRGESRPNWPQRRKPYALPEHARIVHGTGRIADARRLRRTSNECQVHGSTSCFVRASVGSSIGFTVKTIHGSYTYSVPKSAFDGAPTALKDGDLVTFCAETGDSGGQSTTTITQFSDQDQPAATGTPPSR